MSSESMNMDWLDQNNLKSVAARRFAEFCRQDIEAYDDPDDPDKALYQEASMLILHRIEKAVTGD